MLPAEPAAQRGLVEDGAAVLRHVLRRNPIGRVDGGRQAIPRLGVHQRQALWRSERGVETGDRFRREVAAAGVEGAGYRGEVPRRPQLVLDLVEQGRCSPHRGGEPEDDVGGPNRDLTEVFLQYQLPQTRVRAGDGTARIEARGRVPDQEGREPTEEEHPDDEGAHRLSHDAACDSAPDAGTPRPRVHACRPEQPGADDGKQGRQEGEFDQQHDADADRQSRTHPAVQAEGRQKEAEERAHDRQRGEGDGGPHSLACGHDGLVGGHARRQILPVTEQEEEAVVGARAEHQRRQKKLQQGGDVDADMGRFGDEGSRQCQRQARRSQGDEWCEDGTEREREQHNDEQDGAHNRDGLGAHRRRLLIDEYRQRAGEVQRETRGRVHAPNALRTAFTASARPSLPPPAVAQ